MYIYQKKKERKRIRNFFNKIFTMNQSDKSGSNFTETIERTPSNIPSYASLIIRRWRNNRRVRHGITIDLIRVRKLPTQNTNNPFFNGFFSPKSG